MGQNVVKQQCRDCKEERVHECRQDGEEEGEPRADVGRDWTAAGGGILEELLAAVVEESKPDSGSFDLRGGAAGSRQVGPQYI